MSLETDYSKQDVCWPDPHTFEGILRISRLKHKILKGSKRAFVDLLRIFRMVFC